MDTSTDTAWNFAFNARLGGAYGRGARRFLISLANIQTEPVPPVPNRLVADIDRGLGGAPEYRRGHRFGPARGFGGAQQVTARGVSHLA